MVKITLKQIMKDSPAENVFWLCNGQTLKNIPELIKALENIDEGIFSYHVNAEKNDFSNWIKDIFKDAELAERLIKIHDKSKYIETIKIRINELTPKIKKKSSKKKKR